MFVHCLSATSKLLHSFTPQIDIQYFSLPYEHYNFLVKVNFLLKLYSPILILEEYLNVS